MARNLKLNIKNAQLAEAFKLSTLKTRSDAPKSKKPPAGQLSKEEAPQGRVEPVVSPKSDLSAAKAQATVAPAQPEQKAPVEQDRSKAAPVSKGPSLNISTPLPSRQTSRTPVRSPSNREPKSGETHAQFAIDRKSPRSESSASTDREQVTSPRGDSLNAKRSPRPTGAPSIGSKRAPPKLPPGFKARETAPSEDEIRNVAAISEGLKLGPTGRHIDDFLKPQVQEPSTSQGPSKKSGDLVDESASTKEKGGWQNQEADKGKRPSRGKEGVKLQRKASSLKSIDTYLKGGGEERGWRKPRHKTAKSQAQVVSAVPETLKVRLPITVKDLAAEMKLKASQLIAQFFMQGATLTLNDLIEDETMCALLGSHFHCDITIDTSREERLAVTDQSIDEEITKTPKDRLQTRAPVVTFMGHVDHGKTSLIDAIRNTNRAAHEAGAITQHIGAFSCQTSHGPVTIVDTPGHAAFAEMRARGAKMTDLVVLVVAGDEGVMEQTQEVIAQAREAGATLVVAANKSDKENFDLDKTFRQLSELDLLPEAWGGTTVVATCSARTKDGVPELLELIALQAELLELKADFDARARGGVIEVQMHKGLGPLATLLVQNGKLKRNDALVFEDEWGRIRNMRDERGREISEAIPSTPVAITGLSGLPSAGEQFICVSSEKEAREIIEGRRLMGANRALQKRRPIADSMFSNTEKAKKILNLVIRADVNGSLDAVKSALTGIASDKVEVNVIAAGVGEVSESDVLLAAASKATVVGFHTQIESHAEPLIKQRSVDVQMFDLIYHLVEGVREIMKGLLDKIRHEIDAGSASIRAIFRSSKLGNIAGCIVNDGTIHRNHQIRVSRKGTIVHRGTIASIKRGQEDVREIGKGLECGILLANYSDLQVEDELQAIEIKYSTQEL